MHAPQLVLGHLPEQQHQGCAARRRCPGQRWCPSQNPKNYPKKNPEKGLRCPGLPPHHRGTRTPGLQDRHGICACACVVCRLPAGVRRAAGAALEGASACGCRAVTPLLSPSLGPGLGLTPPDRVALMLARPLIPADWTVHHRGCPPPQTADAAGWLPLPSIGGRPGPQVQGPPRGALRDPGTHPHWAGTAAWLLNPSPPCQMLLASQRGRPQPQGKPHRSPPEAAGTHPGGGPVRPPPP